MTFEEYWAEVENLMVLPTTAVRQLPSSLSVDTKKRLMKKQPEKTVEILRLAIDQINRGSVESIDRLIKKRL